MLNWQNVIQFYGMNLQLDPTNPDFGSVEIGFNNGRSQVVVLRRFESPYGDLLDIASCIGQNVNPNAMILLSREVSGSEMGGVMTFDNGTVVVRNTIPLFDMNNIQAVQYCVNSVADTADFLEEKYFNVDTE